MHRVGEGGVLMDKWLMVVIGWGIVGPILAIGVRYLISWRMGNVSWRPGCRLAGSRHRPHSITGGFSRTDRSNRTPAMMFRRNSAGELSAGDSKRYAQLGD